MMQEFVELSKRIRQSGVRNTSKFKSLMRSIDYTETTKVAEDLILLLLQVDIECQCLINALSDFNLKKITEEEFKKKVFTSLV